MRLSAETAQRENRVAQGGNLCNSCRKLWQDCGMLDVRTTRRVAFHPRSAGYIVTIACPGYERWKERVEALAIC